MQAKVVFAQINPMVGDIAGNAAKILTEAREAAASGASVFVTPELSICGYPPEDWVSRKEFLASCGDAVRKLASDLRDLTDLAVIVGTSVQKDGRTYNAAALIRNGAVEAFYLKHHLPEYGVFDEPRLFAPGEGALVFTAGGVRFGILICEDGWYPDPAAEARAAGAEVLLSINASPFSVGKADERLKTARNCLTSTGLPAVYVNMVGGQDELVFDGGSFVLNGDGTVISRLPEFREACGEAVFAPGGRILSDAAPSEPLEEDESVYRALMLAVQDYVGKNRFPGVILGLSGGVDSALTLAIAADALGPDRVRAVMMPTEYTADISLEDAEKLARTLGVRYDVIAISSVFNQYMTMLNPYFEGRPWDVTEENLQARIRGMILMALSNKTGALVLTTGNKSESAVGYSTLYGDLAGGFALIRDVLKTRVYRLCAWRNRQEPVIPERILTRAPSAELREGQKDEDSLPPYAVLDRIIESYVEKRMAPGDIARLDGMNPETVKRIITMIHRSEYKRRQSPTGPRISPVGFGRDWRYPITGKVNF